MNWNRIDLHKRMVLVVGAVLSILVSGCASQITNLTEFKPVLLEKSPLMPTEAQLNGTKPKVVVFEIDNGDNRVAVQAGLDVSLVGNVEAVLAGRAELIDRSAAVKLKNEIALVEANQVDSEGGPEITGPEIADYAISGKVTNAGFIHRFTEAFSWRDKNGKLHYIPPHFRYTAEVEGVLKIYKIPSLQVVKTIRFSDNSARTEQARSAWQYVKRDDGLVRSAGADAISGIRLELQNFFGKKGYVIDAKRKGDKVIYLVTFGRNDGVQPGNACEIFTTMESGNQITGKKEYTRVKLYNGTVTNLISATTSWIEADSDHQLLKLGDEVKVISTAGVGDYLNDFSKSLNQLAK